MISQPIEFACRFIGFTKPADPDEPTLTVAVSGPMTISAVRAGLRDCLAGNDVAGSGLYALLLRRKPPEDKVVMAVRVARAAKLAVDKCRFGAEDLHANCLIFKDAPVGRIRDAYFQLVKV
jgi:hypothetical protein